MRTQIININIKHNIKQKRKKNTRTILQNTLKNIMLNIYKLIEIKIILVALTGDYY